MRQGCRISEFDPSKFPNKNNEFAPGPIIALYAFASMDNEKSTDTEDLLREFVAEILRYLVAHPRAKDTITGIEKWWLSQSVSLEGKRKLEESLELLVSKGWLIGRCSPQSEKIYSLNENSLDEIKEFLETRPTNVNQNNS